MRPQGAFKQSLPTSVPPCLCMTREQIDALMNGLDKPREGNRLSIPAGIAEESHG